MKTIEHGIQQIISRISDIKYPFKDQTFLITGGAGFLGSWIADVLIKLDSRVIVIDNLSSGLEKNIQHHKNNGKYRFINHDITIPISLNEEFTYIFHLASRASPFEFSTFPIEILKANTLGILNALETAKEHHAKFLYTSTSEIYGNPQDMYIPTPETYYGNVNPIGPRSCYDEAKRAGEAFLAAYMLEYGLDARIIRIFNTYGPRMRSGNTYGRVIPNFIEQCLNNEKLSIFGDGTQTRSFSYVVDTVVGILRAAFLPESKGEVFNIGNTEEISIIHLARLIPRILKKECNIEYLSLPVDDPRRRCPNISKAKKILNWSPKTEIDVGIRNIVNWIEEENNLNFKLE